MKITMDTELVDAQHDCKWDTRGLDYMTHDSQLEGGLAETNG